MKHVQCTFVRENFILHNKQLQLAILHAYIELLKMENLSMKPSFMDLFCLKFPVPGDWGRNNTRRGNLFNVLCQFSLGLL